MWRVKESSSRRGVLLCGTVHLSWRVLSGAEPYGGVSYVTCGYTIKYDYVYEIYQLKKRHDKKTIFVIL